MNNRPVETAVLRRQSHFMITNLPICAALTAFLSFVYISTLISFPSLIVRCGFNQKIYSSGGLTDRMSPVTRSFWLGRSCLHRFGPRSLLQLVILMLEKCLATCRKVWVTLKMKVNVQSEMTQHTVCCGRAIKPRSFAGFYSSTRFNRFSVYYIRK
jgi:hypothetical protein